MVLLLIDESFRADAAMDACDRCEPDALFGRTRRAPEFCLGIVDLLREGLPEEFAKGIHLVIPVAGFGLCFVWRGGGWRLV